MKVVNNTIKINCETQDYLKLEELKEFQGELKARDDSDIDKAVKSIKKFGFSVPFFVWKHNGVNYIFDGHCRKLALTKLDTLGFLIPPLPVIYVGLDIDNERDARDLLLRINSHYGKMTKESVLEFIGDFDIELSNFELPCGVIDFDDELPDIDFGDEPEEKKRQLGVLVSCDSEHEMEEVFYKLQKMGLSCKMIE